MQCVFIIKRFSIAGKTSALIFLNLSNQIICLSGCKDTLTLLILFLSGKIIFLHTSLLVTFQCLEKNGKQIHTYICLNNACAN